VSSCFTYLQESRRPFQIFYDILFQVRLLLCSQCVQKYGGLAEIVLVTGIVPEIYRLNADTVLAFYCTLQQKFIIIILCISVRRISYDFTVPM